MRRLASSRQRARAGALSAANRRSSIPRAGYLANPPCLMGIPRLERTHAGRKISFGSSTLSALAGTLVETDLASESDWISRRKASFHAGRLCAPPVLERPRTESVAEHFELSLTLGESIVGSIYSDSGGETSGQLFLVLNTESSFAMGVGDAIADLEAVQPWNGRGFLRHPAARFVPLASGL